MAKGELVLNLDVDAPPLMTLLLHSECDTYWPGGTDLRPDVAICCESQHIGCVCVQMSVTLERNAAGNVVAALSEVVWAFFLNINETGIVLLSLVKTLG